MIAEEAINTENDLVVIRRVLTEHSGQMRIAQIGLHVIRTLIDKNSNYGNSAFKPPILCPELTSDQALRCRLSDKIARLQNLLSGNTDLVGESLQDTFFDLAGYSILILVNELENGS